MSKIVLLCLLVFVVAIVSEAGPRGRGRDRHGDRPMKARGLWRRKWAIQRQNHDGGETGKDSALPYDENTSTHMSKPRGGKGNGRRQWKLRRQMRRRNKFRKSQNANETTDDVIAQKKARWMAMKERRLNRWQAKMAKRGCFCLTPEKLQSLREIIVAEGREEDFPEIVPEEVVDEIENEDVDDDDEDVSEADDDDSDVDMEDEDNVVEEVVPGNDINQSDTPFLS